MEFEYWWLLAFPLFFSLGWLAARIDIRHVVSESRTLPVSYFKGLNYLLNEQPDKAVEAFAEVARLEPATVELHFTLGAMFRRRGEVERAIRMHQNLLERPDLEEERKWLAVNELAQDFLRAGLLDRAEQLFQELLGTSYRAAALESLLDIYVQEKEWPKAIDTAKRLAASSTRSFSLEIAQFYCELAVTESIHSRFDGAREYIASALQENRTCVRANDLLGDFETMQGRHDEAIKVWKRIETQDPAYLALIADKLVAACRQLDRLDEALGLLRDYLNRYPSLEVLEGAYRLALEVEGGEAAYRLVRDTLRHHPTLRGLDTLLEAQLMEAPPERRQDLQLIKTLVHSHAERLAFFRCDSCGFRARRFHWRCPACGGWETFPPRRSEEEGARDRTGSNFIPG